MVKGENHIHVIITAGTIIKTIVILALAYFLFLVRDLVLVILAAIVIASAVEPMAASLEKWKLPRTLAVLIVYLLGLTAFFGIIYAIIPVVIEEIGNLAAIVPQYISTIIASEGFQAFTNSDFFAGLDLNQIFNEVGSTFSGATTGALATMSAIFGGIASFLLILVISFYLAVQRNGITNFISLITPKKHESYVIDLWKRSQKKIGKWMQGQLFLGLLIAVLTYLGLKILGVQNAMTLALLTGAFELIPIFGPILAAIPAVILAFLQEGLTLTLLVLGLYLIIQQFENHLIHPLVVKKIVGIPSLIAILSLIIGGTLAGFLGIIIAVPVAAAVMELLDDYSKMKKTSHEIC